MYRWVSSSSWRERGQRRAKGSAGTFRHHGDSSKRYLAFDVLLDEVVLALVVEDHVNLLGAVSADVRPWRDRSHYVLLNRLQAPEPPADQQDSPNMM